MKRGIDVDRLEERITLSLGDIAPKIGKYFKGLGAEKPHATGKYTVKESIFMGRYRVNIEVEVNEKDPRQLVADRIYAWKGGPSNFMADVVETLEKLQPYATEEGIAAPLELRDELVERVNRYPVGYHEPYREILKCFKTQERML